MIEINYRAGRIYKVKDGIRKEIPLSKKVQADIIATVIEDIKQAVTCLVENRPEDAPDGLLGEKS